MKILVDMNLSPLWVPFLGGHGIDAVHWASIGAANASDLEIIDYAARNSFVVLTHDLDFGAVLAARKARGPSVVQVRAQDVLPVSLGQHVLRAIDAAQTHLENGAIVTVDLLHQRIRVLPI